MRKFILIALAGYLYKKFTAPRAADSLDGAPATPVPRRY